MAGQGRRRLLPARRPRPPPRGRAAAAGRRITPGRFGTLFVQRRFAGRIRCAGRPAVLPVVCHTEPGRRAARVSGALVLTVVSVRGNGARWSTCLDCRFSRYLDRRWRAGRGPWQCGLAHRTAPRMMVRASACAMRHVWARRIRRSTWPIAREIARRTPMRDAAADGDAVEGSVQL